MENYSVHDLITKVVNKLFVYTDGQEWDKLSLKVFTEQVAYDMNSIGGDKATLAATEICETWKKGFSGIDAVNHLAGNYIIDISENEATVFAYATATHYKKAATKGQTRDLVGTYDVHLTNGDTGWRIDTFKYSLKYAIGNADLS